MESQPFIAKVCHNNACPRAVLTGKKNLIRHITKFTNHFHKTRFNTQDECVALKAEHFTRSWRDNPMDRLLSPVLQSFVVVIISWQYLFTIQTASSVSRVYTGQLKGNSLQNPLPMRIFLYTTYYRQEILILVQEYAKHVQVLRHLWVFFFL